MNNHRTLCDQLIFCALRQQVGFPVIWLKAIKNNLWEIWTEVISFDDLIIIYRV